MANHSSILAWRIPWTEEPGGLQLRSQRVAKSLTLVKQLNTQSSSEGVGLERLLVHCGTPWGLCHKYRHSSVCPGSRGWGDDLYPSGDDHSSPSPALSLGLVKLHVV